MTAGSALRPVVQLAALAVTTVTAAMAVVYWVKAVSTLGDSAGTNSRLSYADELAGHRAAARADLEQALTDAVNPSDVAFVRYYLGELALTPETGLSDWE